MQNYCPLAGCIIQQQPPAKLTDQQIRDIHENDILIFRQKAIDSVNQQKNIESNQTMAFQQARYAHTEEVIGHLVEPALIFAFAVVVTVVVAFVRRWTTEIAEREKTNRYQLYLSEVKSTKEGDEAPEPPNEG